MSPSLKEKFVQIYDPDTDPLTDLEDMSYAILKLKPDIKFGLIKIGGKTVTLGVVDPTGHSHKVMIDDTGMQLTFSNDEDVYE